MNGYGKRVVVTGVSSFLGCHIAARFADAGWKVTAVVRQPPKSYRDVKADRLRHLEGRVAWQELDLRDDQGVKALIGDLKPHLWIRGAGYSLNYSSPEFDLVAANEINVAPLAPLFEAMSSHSGGVLMTGSSFEYSDTTTAGHETDDCAPLTGYGRSKLAATLFARELSEKWRVPVRVARMYIPYGPMDAPQKFVPYVVSALEQGRAVDLSECTQKRDFIHIDDVTHCYELLARDLERGGFDIFNIASGVATPLRNVAESIAGRLRASTSLLGFGKRPMRANEPPVSFGSADKVRAQLRWNPRSLEAGLDQLLSKQTQPKSVTRR